MGKKMKSIGALVVFACGGGVVAGGKPAPKEQWEFSDTVRIAQARKEARDRADREKQKREELLYERVRLGLSIDHNQIRL